MIRKILLSCTLMAGCTILSAQVLRFEASGGSESAPYPELIESFKKLATAPAIRIREMGMTDAGLPLHLVTINNEGDHNPASWHRKKNVVILINNGIHPGEPDGMDASLMLVRDIKTGKVKLPAGISIAMIPVYNIGGMLNRNSTTRVSQNGPKEYGFRGNSRNFDLNRDFTKNDTKESGSFAQIFHLVKPHVFIDNHVSDGADFQHTLTLITTQYDKLGGDLGRFLKNRFEPAVYSQMKNKGWDVIPYVDFGSQDLKKGIRMFIDPPRYSSGYAALFNTMGFMPETHMLKPYRERVKATYDQMISFIEVCRIMQKEIISEKQKADAAMLARQEFAISWKTDSTQKGEFIFKGYETDTIKSEATGLNRVKYNHEKPFTVTIPYYNFFVPSATVKKPVAYIIPRGWHNVTALLKLNGVKMEPLKNDTTIKVKAYRIVNYKSFTQAYEGHHKNYQVKVSDSLIEQRFFAGDHMVKLNQVVNRYIIEMLEPTGDDSYFAWNFFDGILQQKEGYTDYRWEELAAEVLRKNPRLKAELEQKKAGDKEFASNSSAILDFIYRNSEYYEKSHRLYPVYRIENQ